MHTGDSGAGGADGADEPQQPEEARARRARARWLVGVGGLFGAFVLGAADRAGDEVMGIGFELLRSLLG